MRRGRWLPGLVVFFGVVASCDDATGPTREPPYLAIVTHIDAPSAEERGRLYHYRVQELSGTLHIDKTITADPTDTVIVSLPAATYLVTLEDLPAQCHTRDGVQQAVYIPPNSNTSLLRYLIDCQSQLTLSTLTDGQVEDSGFVYAVTAADGTRRIGILQLRDTVRLNDLPSGPTRIELAQVSSNCVVTSDGGVDLVIPLDSLGGHQVAFRVICSDPARRPELLSLHADYHDGAAGMVFTATDPNHDIESYFWDLTDCHRRTRLPSGARFRRGLTTGATAGLDTVVAMAAFEIGLPDAIRDSSCAALWVVDDEGNQTPVVEVPFGTGPGSAPHVSLFNARLNGTQLITTQLAASDPEGDLLGTFGAAVLRDGIFGTPDGKPDIGVFNATGYMGVGVPDLVFNPGLTYEDVSGVIVYLFDSAGHFTRLLDAGLFE